MSVSFSRLGVDCVKLCHTPTQSTVCMMKPKTAASLDSDSKELLQLYRNLTSETSKKADDSLFSASMTDLAKAFKQDATAGEAIDRSQ